MEMNKNKPYVVFTTYPEYPKNGLTLSNNKPYMGVSTSPEKLRELGKKVYPVLAHHLDLPFTTRCPDIKEEELIDGKKPQGVKRLNDLFKFDLQWTYLKNSMEEAGIKE